MTSLILSYAVRTFFLFYLFSFLFFFFFLFFFEAAGGREAALFTVDLLLMYQHYSDSQGWQFKILDLATTSDGGYKEVTANITGYGSFGQLKFESGVHRVQRVPETESKGRTHTSTVVVSVLPEPEDNVCTNPEYSLSNLGYPLANPGYSLVNHRYSLVNPIYTLANPGYPLVTLANPGYSLVNPGYALANPGYPLANPGYALAIPGYALANFSDVEVVSDVIVERLVTS